MAHHFPAQINGGAAMRYDESKIDEAVLGLLYLTSFQDHGSTRAWKGHDWDALGRLHAQGLIDDPRNRNKSIVFSADGLSRAKAACERLFAATGGK
jgi:hypothetical protein